MDSTTDLQFPLMCLQMWPAEVFTFCCGVCHFCQKVEECRSHHSRVNTFERWNVRSTCTWVTHTRPTQPLKTVWVMMSHILAHLFACLPSHRVSLSTCDLIDQKAFLKSNVNRPNENAVVLPFKTQNCRDKTSSCWLWYVDMSRNNSGEG